MSPDELDFRILTCVQQRWRKVALVVASLGQSILDAPDYDAIAARIVVLVEAGKLEAKGDFTEWRHSEVRVPLK
jgi:hypothetical protein